MLDQLFKLPIFLKEGLIIDIEAIGSPSRGKIITFGYCVDDFIEIFQLENESEKEISEMSRKIERIKETLKIHPRKLIGYNVKGEEQWLGVKFDLDLFERQKEWSKKIEIKPPKLIESISLFSDYYEKNFLEKIFGEKKTLDQKIKEIKIPNVWRMYLKTKDRKLLEALMWHNANDIFRTLFLYINDQALEYFPINERGKVVRL